MKFLILLSIFTFSLSGVHKPQHPVHVSVCNIDYFPDKKISRISLRIFTDDFNMILRKNYGKNLRLGTNSESFQANLYTMLYIRKNLSFFSKAANLRLISREMNSEENTTTLNLKVKEKLKSRIRIKNTLLTDLYSDQKNLLIFTVGENQFAHKFSKSDTLAFFEIGK